jgi:hypothetical protein
MTSMLAILPSQIDFGAGGAGGVGGRAGASFFLAR